VAEDVAKVDSDLVACDDEGKPSVFRSTQNLKPVSIYGPFNSVLFHFMTQKTAENGSVESKSRCTDEGYLLEWKCQHPSIPALMGVLECPVVFEMMAKTPRIRALLQSWLDHWKEDGRPEIALPGIDRREEYLLGPGKSSSRPSPAF